MVMDVDVTHTRAHTRTHAHARTHTHTRRVEKRTENKVTVVKC